MITGRYMSSCLTLLHREDVELKYNSIDYLLGCTEHMRLQDITLAGLQLTGYMEQHLLPGLTGKIPDVEALRIFLILPFISLFADPSNYASMHSPYGHVLTTMDSIPSSVIGEHHFSTNQYICPSFLVNHILFFCQKYDLHTESNFCYSKLGIPRLKCILISFKPSGVL